MVGLALVGPMFGHGPIALIVPMVGAAAGFFLPDHCPNKARTAKGSLSVLPDALDMLTVCRAGLGFDARTSRP